MTAPRRIPPGASYAVAGGCTKPRFHLTLSRRLGQEVKSVDIFPSKSRHEIAASVDVGRRGYWPRCANGT